MSKNLITETLNKKISRRSFIKWSSALGATTTLSGLALSQTAKMVAASSVAPQTSGSTITDWVPSICLVCHSWCRIAVGKDAAGVIRKIEGQGGQPRDNAFGLGATVGIANDDLGAGTRTSVEDDTYNRYCRTKKGTLPYSIHNRGRICAKGNDGMEHTYDAGRVRDPLIRTGLRGAGTWKKITWQQVWHGDPATYLDNGSGKLFPWLGIAKLVRDMGTAAVGNRVAHNYSVPGTGSYYDDVLDVAGTATRRTHRLVIHVGRNESDNAGGTMVTNFAASIGTPNYVEHTNLCESSRHTAQLLQQKDKFPMIDNCIHNELAPTITTDTRKKGDGKTNYTLSAKDDTDLLVLHGGNLTEAMIPHASFAQRAADIRRNGGRVVYIDVRSAANTYSWADEGFYLKPGTDGALAAGIIYQIMTNYSGTSAALRTRLGLRVGASGNMGHKGIFVANEPAGAAPDGTPLNKSLEAYANGLLVGDPAAGVKDTAWTLTQIGGPGGTATNITADDIMYLAWACSGGFGMNLSLTGNSWWPKVGGVPVNPPRNPCIDGYRGPAKHSNGSYNYLLLRALATIACGFNDGTAATATEASENAKRAGCVNRPGTLIHDAYDGVYKGVGITINNTGDANSHVGTGSKIETSQRLDNWDYYGNGGPKWNIATHKVYSQLIPGVRASVGLHPFKDGPLPPPLNSNPYGAAPGNGKDTTFKTEILFNHKSNCRFSMPGAATDDDLFTSVGSNGYRLKYLFSSDINMGDTTIFADVILPDTSYLERYVNNWHEGPACKIIMGMRQPVWQSADGENLHLYRDLVTGYGTRPIRQMLYQLARAVESDTLDVKGDATTRNPKTGWGGDLFDTWAWDNNGAHVGGGMGVDAYRSDRAWFRSKYEAAGSNPLQTGAPAGDEKFTYMRVNGFWESPENYTPNYWKDTTASLIEVYHSGLDATTDPTGNLGAIKETGLEANQTFFGTPLYVPIRKNGGFPSELGGPYTDDPNPTIGKYNLTTYKVNVHTQARTGALPRLAEIIGQNWAVFAPGSKDKNSITIANGDTVRLSAVHRNLDGTRVDTLINSGIWEAKVDARALNPTIVSVSQSFGHDIDSFRDPLSAPSNWVAPSTEYVRSAPPGTGGEVRPVAGQRYHGTSCSWIMTRGAEDPVGSSVAWFDTMVEVEIIP